VIRPRWLGFLPAFLFRADTPAFGYVLKAWLLVLLPSLALSGLLSFVLPEASGPRLGLTPFFILLLVVVSPALETLIMAAPLIGLRRLVGPGPAVVASAAGWAVAHSLAAPAWGLVVWWPFLILSIAFLAWRERGFWRAIAVVAAIHGLQNGAAVLILLAMRLTGGSAG
jgi:membrane protease YdiL (CAAX protease family)